MMVVVLYYVLESFVLYLFVYLCVCSRVLWRALDDDEIQARVRCCVESGVAGGHRLCRTKSVEDPLMGNTTLNANSLIRQHLLDDGGAYRS